MLKYKSAEHEIITMPTIFSPSQWLPFELYDWFPKFPRYAPNAFLFSPLTFFYVYIAWHNKFETIYPHSKKYRMLRAISVSNLKEVVSLL